MVEKFMKFVREEEGQGMAEYGLILAGVAVVCIAIFFTLGGEIKSLIGNVASGLTTP
ncbi:Flp family type IVb pilin [Aquibacillus halophilus]|uniref:Flp family type IVb pilin n=1 Tax=Aquibacillus halophilus TaxID=930132 RepID=A0A6A8DKK9_9BACI|nr:Flp family type IVb pilin [Aquibacillus halophilus]MRH44311.1 Flp family type IVb pilin [Aquibacillus halophilus]